MKLGIDIDGCLAQFGHAYADALIEHTGENRLPENFKEDPNWPPTWNWHYDAGYSREACEYVWKNVVEGKGFWANLEPLPGAPETIRGLNRLVKSGHDIYFLTHRSGKLAKRQTENWLEDHGMERPTVLLTSNKLPIINGLELEFFIDDKLSTVQEVAQHYHERTPAPAIFLKDAPYNRIGRWYTLKTAASVEDALRQAGLWQDPKRGRPRIAA